MLLSVLELQTQWVPQVKFETGSLQGGQGETKEADIPDSWAAVLITKELTYEACLQQA